MLEMCNIGYNHVMQIYVENGLEPKVYRDDELIVTVDQVLENDDLVCHYYRKPILELVTLKLDMTKRLLLIIG